MDILTLLISRVNDVLWTYILIIMLLGCAFWFTFKTNFVQFRMIREMVRLLGDSTGKTEGREHHISSFQAFAVSIALLLIQYKAIPFVPLSKKHSIFLPA